uniref:Uncharacterized protein n=1 Tax=Anas platyrhynchos TaxID=8839 RepID=A0A8B9SNP7_ANAPL
AEVSPWACCWACASVLGWSRPLCPGHQTWPPLETKLAIKPRLEKAFIWGKSQQVLLGDAGGGTCFHQEHKNLPKMMCEFVLCTEH